MFPTDTQSIFYDDGDATTAGTDDYALINDLSIEDGDIIQLVGETSDYSLDVSPEDLPSGTAIYLNDGALPELIAIIADIEPDPLDLDNSHQFTFELV